MCQIILMVLILETTTSSICNVEHQTGCRSGEYCSFSIANGQCNDCSVILPNDPVLLEYEHHLPRREFQVFPDRQ